MTKGFYNLTSGILSQSRRLDTVANNMTNLSTSGYKAEQYTDSTFQEVLISRVGNKDKSSPTVIGEESYILAPSQLYVDYSQGSLEETGRKQDYAIVGDGFFALYDPDTGEISYTRDGSFALSSFQQIKEDGTTDTLYYLADGEGRQVLDTNGYPIVVTDAEARQPVGVFTIQYLDGLQHVGSGRFVTTEKNGAVWMSPSEVRQGYLESSNVDLASEMGKVIEAQRTYSYVLRMMQTADEIETTVNNLTNG